MKYFFILIGMVLGSVPTFLYCSDRQASNHFHRSEKSEGNRDEGDSKKLGFISSSPTKGGHFSFGPANDGSSRHELIIVDHFTDSFLSQFAELGIDVSNYHSVAIYLPEHFKAFGYDEDTCRFVSSHLPPERRGELEIVLRSPNEDLHPTIVYKASDFIENCFSLDVQIGHITSRGYQGGISESASLNVTLWLSIDSSKQALIRTHKFYSLM